MLVLRRFEVQGNKKTEPAVFAVWRCWVLAVPGWNMLFTGVYEPKWSVLFLHEIVCSLQRLGSLKRIKNIMYLFPSSSSSNLPTVCTCTKEPALENGEITLVMLNFLFSSCLQHLSFSVFFVVLSFATEFLTFHKRPELSG